MIHSHVVLLTNEISINLYLKYQSLVIVRFIVSKAILRIVERKPRAASASGVRRQASSETRSMEQQHRHR